MSVIRPIVRPVARKGVRGVQSPHSNVPGIVNDFAYRMGFKSTVTFTRASTVNGWTLDANGDPVLTEFASGAPAFVIDPATGQSLGYRALQGFTNSLLWSRDLSNAVWTGSATVAQDAVGLDGVANTAWTVTDDDASGFESRSQILSVTDNTNTHAVPVYIRKDEDESRIPELKARLSGGTSAIDYRAQINTKTGATAPRLGSSASDITVKDVGVFWKLILFIPNNGTGNTTLKYEIYPAITSTLGGAGESSATGSIVYDFGGVYLNSIAGPPIETEGSPVSTAADDATESVPTSLQSAGTLLISARTANGLSGDQVLAQMDDGTENNRVRIVRNSSREVRYIVTDGGTEVANLNLGTVADDTDTTVAIRYGTDDYAGIVSGGTLQSDTTGTMPSISTLRHGRDTADGDEWNGTIAEVRGNNAWTDSQLEGAV